MIIRNKLFYAVDGESFLTTEACLNYEKEHEKDFDFTFYDEDGQAMNCLASEINLENVFYIRIGTEEAGQFLHNYFLEEEELDEIPTHPGFYLFEWSTCSWVEKSNYYELNKDILDYWATAKKILKED